MQYHLRGLVVCFRLLVVGAARGAIVDHITDAFFRVGVPGDSDIVLSGPGKSYRGGEKGGGESEEFLAKKNPLQKTPELWKL